MTSIYRYAVREEYDSNPMYGRSRKLKDFGDDLLSAVKWAEENYKKQSNPDGVYVEEREYVSERNLERDFSLYTRWMWSPTWSDEMKKVALAKRSVTA